ncbi:serine-rich adhesin for platelets-like [Mytilus trossulus]|uniref:serine-rich adhesin for platelets-like n=1 Tax=Mytilus trossulus TaxID=6551 RepID=UPI0030059D30
MIDVRVIVILVLLTCPLVSMSPLRGEGENGEQCPGNYCSMFEGICKNGGTCISIGCKGECECTKDFTGHNCEVPITALTTLAPKKETEAPKKKETKPTTDNTNEKMSVILSLFRMMSHPRPKVTNHIVKKKIVIKVSNKKDSDKDSHSIDRTRENFPSRFEPLSEKKQDESSNDKDSSDRQKESQRTKQINKSNTQDNGGESESKSLITEKVDKTIVSTSESVVKNDIFTVAKKISDKHTPELSLTTSNTLKIINTTPTTTTQSTFAAIQEQTVAQVSPLLSTTNSGSITTIQSTPSSIITTPDKVVIEKRVNEDTLTFSGKTRKVVPKVFHAPQWRSLSQETTTVNPDVLLDGKINEQQNHSSLNNSDILAHLANAGDKVLSSTTLSNMYLTHTLLSKSRIFVSTVPNKTIRPESTKKPSVDNASTQSQVQINGGENKQSAVKERSTSIDLAKEEIALAAKRIVIANSFVVTTTSLPTKSIKAGNLGNLVTRTQPPYVKSTSHMLKQGTQNMSTKTSTILPITNNLSTTTNIGILGNSPTTVMMSTTKSPSKLRLRKSLLSHNSGDIQNHKRINY